jgi:hypothetical protein
MRRPALLTALLVLAASLTACAPAASDSDAAFDHAWSLCVGAHPARSETVPYTPEEACQRWLDRDGRATFVETWDEEYAELFRNQP